MDKSMEELRIKAKELSIPIYQEDEDGYTRDISTGSVKTPEEWLKLNGEFLKKRREEELEALSNRAEEDYKAIRFELTGVNSEMPVLVKTEVPDGIDWRETFMAISDLSDNEWPLAVAKQEKKESSKPFQEKLEGEWRLAEGD